MDIYLSSRSVKTYSRMIKTKFRWVVVSYFWQEVGNTQEASVVLVVLFLKKKNDIEWYTTIWQSWLVTTWLPECLFYYFLYFFDIWNVSFKKQNKKPWDGISVDLNCLLIYFHLSSLWFFPSIIDKFGGYQEVMCIEDHIFLFIGFLI